MFRGFRQTDLIGKPQKLVFYYKTYKAMTKLKIGFTILITLLYGPFIYAQEITKISAKDFKVLEGSWQGSLTYLDYSSGKPYTMPADAAIKRLGKTNQFIFSNIYPNETSANSIDTVTISIDRQFIGTQLVKSKKRFRNGTVEIISEELGTDGNNNKAATFRNTYTISKTFFKKRKDVQFIGEANWINRHEYSYKRKPRK